MVSTTSVLFVSPLLWEWHKTLIPALNDAAEKRKQGRRPFERKNGVDGRRVVTRTGNGDGGRDGKRGEGVHHLRRMECFAPLLELF